MSVLAHVRSYSSFFFGRIAHKFRSLDDRTGEEDAAGKIVVITGANAGLGKVLCLQMAKRGAIVVMACRDVQKAIKVIDEIHEVVPEANLILVKLDLQDLDSVRRCAQEIMSKVPWINILVCNAGYMGVRHEIERTKDGFERNMGINHLGHFLLTLLLVDLVKRAAPSRIIVLSSMAHQFARLDIDDINMVKGAHFGIAKMRPYANSKLCNALFARELSKRLEGTGVHVYALCPGVVNTGLFDGDEWTCWQRFVSGASLIGVIGLNPEQGIETILYCSLSMDCAQDTGRLYRFRKLWKSADRALDELHAPKLWEISEELVGLRKSSVDTAIVTIEYPIGPTNTGGKYLEQAWVNSDGSNNA